MPQKPFFRKHGCWWVVQMRQGKKRWQHKLVKGSPPRGSDTRDEAYKIFNKLMEGEVDQLPAPTKLRVTDILRAFLRHSAENNSPRTFEFYQTFLVSFDDLYGSLRPYQVTQEIVDAWLNSEKGWKGSRRGAVASLKRAFNWACDNNKLVKNPLKSVKKPAGKSRDRFLTREERQKIFDNYPAGDCFRDFLFALEHTGCRPGEVGSVTAADVDLRTGVWVLDEHKTEGKTGEKRIVILTPELVDLTKRLMVKHPNGPLFRDRRGEAWNRNSVRCRFRRVRVKLKLGGDLVAYLYRHATCTDMLEAGVGVAQAAEILGHKGTGMVMRHYNHISQKRDHLREQVMKARRNDG